MLRAAWTAWLDSRSDGEEPDDARFAFHSDIRALRPEAWSCGVPNARGREVEQAMWLAGVSSRDFDEVIDIALTPDRVTPVNDIATLCTRRARACQDRADALRAELPPPNPYGRPPLPWDRNKAREASALHRAARAWEALGRYLLSNRW